MEKREIGGQKTEDGGRKTESRIVAYGDLNRRISNKE
jgi:hypothetical protein